VLTDLQLSVDCVDADYFLGQAHEGDVTLIYLFDYYVAFP
jgi:hypothetical protein